MDKIKSIRGMHDIYGSEFLHQKQIIDLFESVATNFNFKPIATPIMEFNEIFSDALEESFQNGNIRTGLRFGILF